MLDLSRRSFLRGLGAALATPAIVKFELLMPIKALVVPEDLMVGLPTGIYYPYTSLVQPITFDQFTERVLSPMIKHLQRAAINNIMEYGDIEPPSLLERSLFNA